MTEVIPEEQNLIIIANMYQVLSTYQALTCSLTYCHSIPMRDAIVIPKGGNLSGAQGE